MSEVITEVFVVARVNSDGELDELITSGGQRPSRHSVRAFTNYASAKRSLEKLQRISEDDLVIVRYKFDTPYMHGIEGGAE